MRWTDSQRAAIEHGDGLLAVVAGAGSGKTGVLTERFVHLVAERDVPPEHILTITFTRAATAEMKTRIIRKLEQRGLHDARTRIESAYIHTVHALCRRILQENPFEAGIDPEPSVLPAPAANHLRREAFHRALANLLRNERDFETDPLIDLIADYLNLDSVRGDPLQALYALAQRVADATRHQGYTADDLEGWKRAYPSAEALAWHYVREVLNFARTPRPASWSAEAELQRQAEAALPHSIAASWSAETELQRQAEATHSIVSLATLDDLRDLVANLQQSCPEAARTLASLLADFDPALEQRARAIACALLELTVAYLREYETLKQTRGALDFDDMQIRALQLLRDSATVRRRYQRMFRYTLVDETQDIDRLQARIIDLLSAGGNLMVVGDDAQSIYGFRGAEPENILGFSERWTDAALYRLTINYRSTPQILEVANACIRNNRRQVPKDLQPVCPAGERPALVPVRDSAMEAAFVAQRVLEKVQEGQSLDQMAVLYRAHFQSMELQLELTRRQIPFRVRSGIRFFEQAHIKDVLAFLRLLVNPQDELSWVRVLNLQPGVGRGGALKLFHHARTAADPVAEFAARPPLHLVAAKARNPLQDLAGLLGRLRARENPPPPSQAIAEVLAGGYRERLPSLYENAPARSEELDHLAQYAERFESLEAFLAELNLLASFAAEDVLLARQPEERLTLSTVHQAKGLEWQTVFVIGLSESLFPHARSLQEPGGEEEERRLFYVAATRAARELYLVVPQVADRPGGRRTLLRPSRFVDEVQRAGCLERWSVEEAP